MLGWENIVRICADKFRYNNIIFVQADGRVFVDCNTLGNYTPNDSEQNYIRLLEENEDVVTMISVKRVIENDYCMAVLHKNGTVTIASYDYNKFRDGKIKKKELLVWKDILSLHQVGSGIIGLAADGKLLVFNTYEPRGITAKVINRRC